MLCKIVYVFKGYEQFWNATGWQRGSILIFLEPEKLKELNIFTACHDPGIFDNLNTGESSAAIRFCKNVINKEKKWVSVFQLLMVFSG